MRILSFDIGSHTVKAVELDARFGRVELSDYFMERVVEPTAPNASAASDRDSEDTETDTPAPAEKGDKTREVLTPGQVDAISRILRDRPMRHDRLVISMPRGLVTTRLLTFPTKDRKTIQKTIAFELEDDLPVDLDSTVYDFAIIQPQPNGSTVFTVLALKKDLVALLSQLQVHGVDPDVITTEGWAMSQLMARSIPESLAGAPVCLINLGARQTVFHMFVAERPVLSHTVSVAGNQITHAIAAAYGLGFEQAEKAKVEGGFLLSPNQIAQGEASGEISEDQKRFAQVISDAMLPILREIKQTLVSFKSQYQMSPQAIFITGGTSLLPNMSIYLEEVLEIPVLPMQYSAKAIAPSLQLSESTEAQFSSAMGLALSSVKIDRNTFINLRKDDFEKRGGTGGISLESFRKPLKYLAASLAFIYLNLVTQYFVLSARSKAQTDTFERAIKAVLGTSSRSTINTYVNSPSTLKNAVNKEVAKYKTTTVEPPKKQTSALAVLNKLSSAAPRDITLDVSQFIVKDGRVQIRGLVGQVAEAERLAKALEDTKLVTELDRGKPEVDNKTNKTRFEFTAKLTEATDATATR